MATLNLTKKTTAGVLKSLTKIVDDLGLIAQEEGLRIDANNARIHELEYKNAEHEAEKTTAEKVKKNIETLLGKE